PMTIATRKLGAVFEILLANPPVNALNLAVRKGLLAALAEAMADPAVSAVVIRGEGRGFCAGADIGEFDTAPRAPLLPEVIAAVEAATKPVVAAIHGEALGGGLELALACHYRIATPTARLGLPEVKLGLLPGAGGTQRLPRLVGVAEALAMIVSGSPVSGAKAKDIGLVDELAGLEDLADRAVEFAAAQSAPRRTDERALADAPGAIDQFIADNRRHIAGLDAPKASIEAVRAAAQLPLAEGLAREHALFLELLAGGQSRALRHAFLAERLAAKVDDLPPGTPTRPIATVGVIGAGTMGAGIAINLLSAGIPVTILDRDEAALRHGVDMIRANYTASATKGRIAATDVERLMGLLTPNLNYAALSQCDLIIEAVFEDMAVKVETFRRLDAVAKPGAILASNTSFLDINAIAAQTSRPADVLGLHFFSPAHVMKLLEVVRGKQTAPDILATAMQLARRIGKLAVLAGVCDGFIGNRILFARQDQADALVLEGATPEQVDKVHLDLGMPMGPFQMADLAGLDIGWHRDPARIENMRDGFCAIGRFGQKSRAGFYDYDDRRKPCSSATAQKVIDDHRASKGIVARAIGEEEIVARTIYVMANEAAKVLEEGIAQRASDIDVVWLYGYGWPRASGGLIHWANERGLAHIVDQLQRYAHLIADDFLLSPLLVECAEGGRQLDLG
ncbi:MAG TPA: 3-hydroxyacyl-CoA dehydrogenase NAD-binding domain-containing protein, partial [Bradyrhizobium sp.]|nr:3-hydroxyacyl-CoA dehydrogenase NAD-binding domain-containing protein [Bradyrhizobium sp.]